MLRSVELWCVAVLHVLSKLFMPLPLNFTEIVLSLERESVSLWYSKFGSLISSGRFYIFWLCRRNAVGYALGCEVHFSLMHVESLICVLGRNRNSVEVVFWVYNTLFCVPLAEKWSSCLKRLIHLRKPWTGILCVNKSGFWKQKKGQSCSREL